MADRRSRLLATAGGASARRPRPALRLPLRVLMLLALAACQQQAASKPAAPPPAPVTVAKPVVKTVMERDDFTGRFDAVAAVEIRARVGGYLASVNFIDGAMVKAGDLLFVIDRRPYEAAFNQASAEVAAAQTRLDFARSELDRTERLARGGNAPESKLDEARQNFLGGQAELNGAKAALEKARLDLDFTEIKSPISGRISRKLVTEGNLISANATLLTTVVAVDPIHFYFDVDERSYNAYVRQDREGTKPDGRTNPPPVTVSLGDDREAPRDGRLDFIDNRIDQATGTMRARAIFDNKDQRYTPGMFGRISIPGSGDYKGVLIPDEAIGADQDRRFVYVVADDGGLRQQVVRPGPRIDGYRVIRQGLTGEESIVINGIQRIRPGAKIAPQPTTLPPTRVAAHGTGNAGPPGTTVNANGTDKSETAGGAAP